MPYFRQGPSAIYYEIHGSGFPLLLLPPGGMAATIDFWEYTPFNAIQVLSQHFRVIAIDQRNAGRSTAPFSDGDPWSAYAEDHVGLLNHLGIERCHVLGCCIGCSYVLRLLRDAPERVVSAVLEQPIGISEENRSLWPDIYKGWAADLCAANPDLSATDVESFGRRMWGGDDFVLSVSRDDVAAIQHPMLVLPGIDLHHPNHIGHEVAELAPNSEVLAPWKQPASIVPQTVAKLVRFLHAHTPATS